MWRSKVLRARPVGSVLCMLLAFQSLRGDEIPQPIRAYFNEVAKATKDADGTAFLPLIDTEQHVSLILEIVGFNADKATKAKMDQAMAGVISQTVANTFGVWTEHRISHLRKSGDTLRVIIHAKQETGSIRRFEFWLDKQDAVYRLFDFAAFDHAATTCQLSAATMDAACSPNRNTRDAIDALSDVMSRSMPSTGSYALEALQEIDPIDLPVAFRNVYRVSLIRALSISGKSANVDSTLAELERLPTKPHILPLLRAHAHLSAGRYEQAIASANGFRNEFGPGAESTWVLARAKEAQGKLDEAIEIYRHGLADTPSSPVLLPSCAELIVDQDHEVKPKQFRDLFRQEKSILLLRNISQRLMESQDYKRLQEILDLYASINDEDADYWTIKAGLLVGQQSYEQAREVLEPLLRQLSRDQVSLLVSEDEQDIVQLVMSPQRSHLEYLRELYFDCMTKTGRSLEAFRFLEQDSLNFERLANKLIELEKPGELKKLLGAFEADGKYETAIKQNVLVQQLWLAKEHRSAAAEASKLLAMDGLEAVETSTYQLEELQFACLLHAKDWDAALAYAAEQEDDAPYYRIFIFAAKGDVGECRRAIKATLELGYEVEDILDTYHLGAFLQKQEIQPLLGQ